MRLNLPHNTTFKPSPWRERFSAFFSRRSKLRGKNREWKVRFLTLLNVTNPSRRCPAPTRAEKKQDALANPLRRQQISVHIIFFYGRLPAFCWRTIHFYAPKEDFWGDLETVLLGGKKRGDALRNITCFRRIFNPADLSSPFYCKRKSSAPVPTLQCRLLVLPRLRRRRTLPWPSARFPRHLNPRLRCVDATDGGSPRCRRCGPTPASPYIREIWSLPLAIGAIANLFFTQVHGAESE
jgi:hypothetical protein